MPMERVAPQSEVMRAIVLEDSPCCEVPHGPRPAGPGRRPLGLPLLEQRLEVAAVAVLGHQVEVGLREQQVWRAGRRGQSQ